MSRKQVVTIHDFYCINCGKKGISLPRKYGKQHEKFHRKKMYCPYCGMVLNHVECKNDYDAFEFKQMFENGDFEEEALESIEFSKQEGDVKL